MRMTLKGAIADAVSSTWLTYRQITDLLNEQGTFPTRDGLLLTQAQVRACVRDHEGFFVVDRSQSPHRIRLHRQ